MLTLKQIIKILRLEESRLRAREDAALRGEKWALEQIRREREEERRRPPEGVW